MNLSACWNYFTRPLRIPDFVSGRESGFSIVEMLVVMAILGMLMGIAWAGFYGMRTSMIVIQNMETLRADIVNAQRSAMLLDRGIDENWIYGIGVDLSSLDEGSNTYTVFKWCSPSDSYENFDDGGYISGTERSICSEEGIAPVAGKKDIPFIGGSVDAEFYAENLDGDFKEVDVILFESVNGSVHFYKKDASGVGVPISDINWASVNLYKNQIDELVVVHNEGIVFTHTGDSLPEYCVSDCGSRKCGEDSCGIVCGVCDPGEICDETGMCSTDCSTECDGRECGTGGCGGSCGECTGSNEECQDGICVCKPNCGSRECGMTDGCDGPCPIGSDGSCPPLQVCNEYGYCEDLGAT